MENLLIKNPVPFGVRLANLPTHKFPLKLIGSGGFAPYYAKTALYPRIIA